MPLSHVGYRQHDQTFVSRYLSISVISSIRMNRLLPASESPSYSDVIRPICYSIRRHKKNNYITCELSCGTLCTLCTMFCVFVFDFSCVSFLCFKFVSFTIATSFLVNKGKYAYKAYVLR